MTETTAAAANASLDYARAVPVTHDADLVVIGAGPAGFATAIKAARMGVKTIIVEKFDMPGGVHTSGLQGHAAPGVGGIHSELMRRFEAEGHIYTATEETHPGWAGNPLAHYEFILQPGAPFKRMSFNPDGAGTLMLQMLEDEGVDALYGCTFVDVEFHSTQGPERKIKSIIVKGPDGLFAITGRIFVEASGTGEVVARAGVPYKTGGGGQPDGAAWDGVKRPIPGGLLWLLSGVDYRALNRYQQESGDARLTQLIEKARAAGDIPDILYRPRMAGSEVYGEHYIGHPTVDMSPMLSDDTFILWQNVPYEWALHMDESVVDHTKAVKELRRLINIEAAFLKKYVPGFEKSFVAHVGRQLGVRDGRHPEGEHCFTLDDVLANRTFPDAVTEPLTRNFFWNGFRKHTFEVPYRSFLPKGVDNLLLTGASMSFAYETIFMAMRNFTWCTQTGEIAGYAAAKALAQNVTPKAFRFDERYIFPD
jgi:hypothetical protein